MSSTVNGTTTAYAYAGASQDQLLTESISGGAAYTFTYGRNSGQGVPEIDTETSAGATSRVLSDAANGQVLGLTNSAGDTAAFVVDGTNNQVAALTDTGTVAFQAAYDPYGTGGVSSGGSSSFWTQNPYGFCAGDRTSTSQGGLVKFGQRWYNTATGNWTQQDTLDAPLDPSNADRYAYAGGDPVNATDPRGLASFLNCTVAYLGLLLTTGLLIGAVAAGPIGFGASLIAYGFASYAVLADCYGIGD